MSMKWEEIALLGVGAYLLFGMNKASTQAAQTSVGATGANTAPPPDQSPTSVDPFYLSYSGSGANPSVVAGLNAINSGQILPRLSQTIGSVGTNSNVAVLADGSIKLVSLQNAKTVATPSGYVAQANVQPTGLTPDGYKRWF